VISRGQGQVERRRQGLPLDVKAGDKILFGKYSGTEIKLDGEEFLIMREEEVLGIVRSTLTAISFQPSAKNAPAANRVR